MPILPGQPLQSKSRGLTELLLQFCFGYVEFCVKRTPSVAPIVCSVVLNSHKPLSECNRHAVGVHRQGRVARPSFVFSHEGARVMAGKNREDLIKLAFSHEVNRAAPLQERYGGVEPG